MSDYNKKNAKRDIAAFAAHKGPYTEQILWNAYHGYAALGDHGSANALRQVMADKFYGGGYDLGHLNALRHPYAHEGLQMNSVGQLLGVPPNQTSMPQSFRVVNGQVYLGDKPY
jgi:hypothetical protein